MTWLFFSITNLKHAKMLLYQGHDITLKEMDHIQLVAIENQCDSNTSYNSFTDQFNVT